MGRIVKQLISKDKKIAVLYGGLSNERDVSLRSGKNVYNALQRLGYSKAELVDVTVTIANVLKEGKFDLAYNALHGRYGEDGCIQGVLEILQIPYTGCGVMASSLCMNKEYTKRILRSANIPLIKSVFIEIRNEELEIRNENNSSFLIPNSSLIKELKYPLMLKPVSEGSSIGMYKVESEAEFEALYKKSCEYNQDILVEEFLTGSGCTVGVVDDVEKGGALVTEILELRTKKEWYDYECKYTPGMTEFILPAEYSKELTREIKGIALEAHKTCGCSGVSRVDFLVADGKPYVLEINTSPGMTDLSDLPAQAGACGIDYDNLVQLILNSAGLNK